MKNKIYIRDGRAPIPEREVTSKIMSSIIAKNTKPEILLRKALWSAGLKGYRLYWDKVPGKPDIVFPGRKIAIFVNGCYWHRCPFCHPSTPKTNVEFWQKKFETNQTRDARNNELLERAGWRVVIIWECQIKRHLSDCIENIMSVVNSTR